ncbi:MAG: MalM family protein [Steroidobacteraceae bacterium]
MNVRLALIIVECGLLAACATSTRTTFATSSSPATIQEQAMRDGPSTWGGAMLLRAGDADIGYAIRPIGQTFTVNPGATVIWAWYYGSRKGLDGSYIQSDPVDMRVTLAPAGRYELMAQVGAYELAQTRAGVGTVRFSLVDLTSNKAVATSPENLLLKGPSRLAGTEFKVSPRIWDALASAQSCCAGMQAFRFQPLPVDGYLDQRIDTDSQAFAFKTGKSYFLAYQLPRSDRTTSIEVDSWVHDTVFFPRVLLLDKSFAAVGFVGAPAVHFVPAGPVESDHYEADCSIGPGNPARYLIILTTDTDLGSVLELSANVSFTQGPGGGAAPAANSDQAVLGAGTGASGSPTDLPPSAHDARAVTTTLAGATVAHDFAPTGRLTISVSHR